MGDAFFLPEAYQIRMKELLGEEYPAYLDSFGRPSRTALRIQTNKISKEQWMEKAPFACQPIPWTEKGFLYCPGAEKPSKHPYYFAGLYYLQEPSAMVPASLLPVAPGDWVLDLCAAPGGKAAELGAGLMGQGLLLANDISVSRTRALMKNLQLAGIYNALVTAEEPVRLAKRLGGCFDKILVDAPCSGEGMFRREPRMVRDWLAKGPDDYVPLQREILSCAYEMLKPGGMLMYSTCTFSLQENEEVIQWMLNRHGDMELCPVERFPGFSPGRPDLLEGGDESLRHCVRCYPHCSVGEGQFAALLRKKGRSACHSRPQEKSMASGERRQAVREMLNILGQAGQRGEKLRWTPPKTPDLHGLRVVQGGVSVGECKGRALPSPQLALLLRAEDVSQAIDFSPEDGRVIRYLKGETLDLEEKYKGDTLICVDGYGLGWCQGNGQGRYKNKYYPGWRYK